MRSFVIWLLGDAVKTNEQRAELLRLFFKYFKRIGFRGCRTALLP